MVFIFGFFPGYGTSAPAPAQTSFPFLTPPRALYTLDPTRPWSASSPPRRPRAQTIARRRSSKSTPQRLSRAIVTALFSTVEPRVKHRLVPCPACSRHVRNTASACPFCSVALDPAPSALLAGAVLTGALALAGCAHPNEPTAPLPQVQPEANPPGSALPGPAPSSPPVPAPVAVVPVAPAVPANPTPPPPPVVAPPDEPTRPMVARYGVSPRRPLPNQPDFDAPTPAYGIPPRPLRPQQ